MNALKTERIAHFFSQTDNLQNNRNGNCKSPAVIYCTSKSDWKWSSIEELRNSNAMNKFGGKCRYLHGYLGLSRRKVSCGQRWRVIYWRKYDDIYLSEAHFASTYSASLSPDWVSVMISVYPYTDILTINMLAYIVCTCLGITVADVVWPTFSQIPFSHLILLLWNGLISVHAKNWFPLFAQCFRFTTYQIILLAATKWEGEGGGGWGS